MFNWVFILAMLFALLDWASTWKSWKKRLYIAKPALMILLALWSYQQTGWQHGMVWFGIALVLSLLGDILLLLNPRYFLIGGSAFFFAHLAYLTGFNLTPTPPSAGVFLVAAIVGVSAAIVYRRIKPGIMRVPRGKRFLSALSLYGLSLTFMLLSALLTFFKPDWATQHAVLAAGGAISFFASDTMLIYDRFIKRLPHAQSYVHITYHIAQFSIITGAMLHFIEVSNSF